jgi:hypothetical protein
MKLGLDRENGQEGNEPSNSRYDAREGKLK